MDQLGTLLWWELSDTDTLHAVLSETAAECGYPAIALPVPISRPLAFSRAVTRGCVNLPRGCGKWRVDLVKGKPPTIITAESATEVISSGLLQRWAPESSDDKTPWKGQAFLTLPKEGENLVFSPFVSFDPEKDPLPRVALRIKEQFDRQRKFATAAEIRESAQSALKRAQAIRVRPGLYLTSTDEANELAKAAARWLRCAGNSRAGAIDLLTNGRNLDEAKAYVETGLKDELSEALHQVEEAVTDLKRGASLRDRLQALQALRAKISAHAAFLGQTADALHTQVDAATRLLDQAARVHDVDLEPEIKRGTIQALSRVLNAVQEATGTRDAAKLKDTVDELRRRQGAANASAFGDLWTRLRKLTDYALESPDGFDTLRRAAAEVRNLTHLGVEGADFREVRTLEAQVGEAQDSGAHAGEPLTPPTIADPEVDHAHGPAAEAGP